MQATRREFMVTAGMALAAGGGFAQGSAPMRPERRIIYYNNFASHLLCAYNPNMYYPGLPHRWTDADWCGLVDMIAGFGFNVFEFWLEPRMFCREALGSEAGAEYARQMNVVIDHAARRGMKSEVLIALATVGDQWRTLCPNVKEEWAEVRFLWDSWLRKLPGVGIAGIFPGDPGACSRNGCTAETYIDKSIEIALLAQSINPEIEIDFGTWGPPFFGWGNIHMPPDSKGEFIPVDQASAWTFSKERATRAMEHLLRRLPDFPEQTAVSINMGFNPDGIAEGEQDARPWARRIAEMRPIQTWDFSLTEGENAVAPHYRFDRLFARRREEQAAAPYRGGICFTMTPLLNQLSLYEAAQSFLRPDADPLAIAGDFFARVLGEKARGLADAYRLFEVLPDWGAHGLVTMPRAQYHKQVTALAERLADLDVQPAADAPFHPGPDVYRDELLSFARLFADLSAPAPDYDALKQQYWQRVYAIYDKLPAHVDPRPHAATDRLVAHFANWKDS